MLPFLILWVVVFALCLREWVVVNIPENQQGLRALETIRVQNQWKRTDDGCLWRIMDRNFTPQMDPELRANLPGQGDYLAVVVHANGGILLRRFYLSYYTGETAILDFLSKRREKST